MPPMKKKGNKFAGKRTGKSDRVIAHEARETIKRFSKEQSYKNLSGGTMSGKGGLDTATVEKRIAEKKLDSLKKKNKIMSNK